MGLFITGKSGVYGGAKPIIEVVNIPARGNLIMDNKSDALDNEEFEDFEKTYNCCLAADEGIDIDAMARNIYAWLFQAIERSELYDTYEPGYYRSAYILAPIGIEELAGRLLGGVDITFTCKAYKRAIVGDKTITLRNETTIFNTEGFTSYPYMKIYASGTVSLAINNRMYVFEDINEYIEIDSELMNCYKGDKLQNNKMKSKIFPKLISGKNNISWIGNVNRIEIKPRWCSL